MRNGTFSIVYGATFKTGGSLFISRDNSETAVLEVNGGSIDVAGTGLRIGHGKNGTLNLNRGSVTTKETRLAENANSSSGQLHLNGGMLTTKIVTRNRNVKSGNTAFLRFNGGTLKADATTSGVLIETNVQVRVASGGGTIDCNGKDIVINATLGQSGDLGGLNFTGGNGNAVAIKNNVNYTGITGVAPGTRLDVLWTSQSKNIITNGLVVTGVPSVGDVIFTCMRGIGDVSLDKVMCPSAPETTFGHDGGTNIIVTSVGAPAPAFWTGAIDNDMSNPGNWSDNAVPGPGTNATIFCADATTLAKGNLFMPSSITFAEGSAAVTIDGDELTGIVAVTNLSSTSHTINAKVYFAESIKVKQAAAGSGGTEHLEKAHVTFAGGAYAAAGYAMPGSVSDSTYSRYIFGKYYLASTSSSRWTVPYGSSNFKRVCVAPDSYLYVPYAGNVSELHVGSGAKVDIGDMSTDNRPAQKLYGEMVVTNLTMTGTGDKYVTYNQGADTPGVFKFNSVTNKMSNNWFYLADSQAAAKHTFYIGAGGLNFSADCPGVYCIGNAKQYNYETIRPWYSDFTIAKRSDGEDVVLMRNVEFCTDDENNAGRIITLEAKTNTREWPHIFVTGSGTLEVTKTANNDTQPTVELKDTVTLDYTTATANLGTGEMTLGAGTTFAFVNSGGTLKLPTATSYVLPSTGSATVRINGDRLRSGEHTILSGVSAGAVDHLIVDPASTALKGRKFSVVEKDGNLVLNISPVGMIIILK